MERCGVAQGPEFYNERHLVSVQKGSPRILELTKEIAQHVTGSVLDLGCGLGILVEFVEGPYVGVDFSPVAIQLARERNTNRQAKFILADLRHFDSPTIYDTVVAIEVLEHLDEPLLAVALAVRLAMRRVVISVPQNMRGRAHVWPQWEPGDIVKMLGPGTKTYPFGPWWIGILDLT